MTRSNSNPPVKPIKTAQYLPFWRTVRYTDDGCSVYGCLDCKNEWESRTEPGWFEYFEEFDSEVEGAIHYLKPINGKQIDYWHAKRDTPIYRPIFIFCPFCGIKWDGPIRLNLNNTYMLGPKRLARQLAIEKNNSKIRFSDGYYASQQPKWQWAIQTREVWPDRATPEKWKTSQTVAPININAIGIYGFLKIRREMCLKQDRHSEGLFNVKHEARAITIRLARNKGQS